jgi:hypothetical protein
MSNIDDRLIVEKKEYIDLIAEKHYLMGRVAELEKQVNMLENMLNQK